VPLSDLGRGRNARVHEARLDGDLVQYLRAVGLTLTSRFRICQCGDPCVIQVRSTRIGLSRAVASRIFVVPTAD